MQRTTGQPEHHHGSLTPSKRQKYDNYTPRKRYVKEQEEFGQYRHFTFNESQSTSPLHYSDEQPTLSRSRQLGHSRKREQPVSSEDVPSYRPSRMTNYDIDSYNIPEVLDDCTSMISNRPSFRQKRLRKNDEPDGYKKLNIEDIPKKLNLEELPKKFKE